MNAQFDFFLNHGFRFRRRFRFFKERRLKKEGFRQSSIIALKCRFSVVQACAKALDVSASYLVDADDDPQPSKKRSGPVTPLERRFQEVRKLPKKKQEFILQFLDTILESNQQKKKA
jgi:hypothetical protein